MRQEVRAFESHDGLESLVGLINAAVAESKGILRIDSITLTTVDSGVVAALVVFDVRDRNDSEYDR